jgi:hypothetical protein
MLYHEKKQLVNQAYAMQILDRVDKYRYEVISRNYFKRSNLFEVLGKNLNNIPKIKIKNIKRMKDSISVNIVNTPMTKLIITIDKNLNLSNGDILRII